MKQDNRRMYFQNDRTTRPNLPVDRSDADDRFVWLFDERFDNLCHSFREFLQRRGVGKPEPLMGYDLFPSVVEGVGRSSVAEFRQIAPEQVNRLFLEAWDRSDTWVEGLPGVPVVSFTMEGLAERPGLTLFGPSSCLVRDLNDKASQLRWLQDAGLPVPPFTVLDGLDDLGRRLEGLLSIHEALFVQPTHSAGGELAGLIHAAGDLAAYRDRLVGTGITDTACRFLATRFLPGASSLSGHALISRKGVVLPLAVDELLLNGFRFDGFVFPVTQDSSVEDDILNLTVRVGHILAAAGYWGYFAVDFLHRTDAFLVINEINVRFAGEAAFLAASLTQNMFCLLEDDGVPGPGPLIPRQTSRMVVTKIRPQEGRIYAPPPTDASIQAFLGGTADAVRVHFHDEPIRIIHGHFIGLAGHRFSLRESREKVQSFYQSARQAEHE